MRTFITTTLVLLVGNAFFASTAKAGHEEAALIAGFYRSYLHRAPDAHGMEHWLCEYRRGMPLRDIKAGILGSEEYFCAHGHCPKAFVTGLYEDVLGRTPCGHEVFDWAARLRGCGCRVKLARDFLCAAERELFGGLGHAHAHARANRSFEPVFPVAPSFGPTPRTSGYYGSPVPVPEPVIRYEFRSRR